MLSKEKHFRYKDTNRVKVERMKKTYQATTGNLEYKCKYKIKQTLKQNKIKQKLLRRKYYNYNWVNLSGR